MDVGDDFFKLDMEIGDYSIEKQIKYFSDFYNSLPEPKTEVNNSYLFVSAIGDFALKINDFDLAEKWGKIGMQYKGIHGLLGEQEFFFGKVYFAKGEMEKAKEYFIKVRKNSGWRLFKGKNPEYRKLVEGK